MTINNRLSKFSKKKKKKIKGDQIICMIFVSNMLMISPHIAFNIPYDLMYDI